MASAAEQVWAVFAPYVPDGVLALDQLTTVLSCVAPELNMDFVNSVCARHMEGEGEVNVLRFLADIYGELPAPVTGLRALASTVASTDGQPELKSLFDTLDKDANGRISSKEWGSAVSENRALMAKYFGGCSCKEVGQAFRWIDVDQSRDLTWEEFVDATKEFEVAFKACDALATEKGRAEFKALFDTLDKDADGKLTVKEWGRGVAEHKELLARYFGGTNVGQIGRAFARIDTNKDKRVSWEEFVDASRQMLPPRRVPAVSIKAVTAAMALDEGLEELKSLFEKLDKDANGKVTSKEWGRAVSENKDLMSKYFGGSTCKEIGQAFNWIDADGSNDLNWEEFLLATKEFDAAFAVSDMMSYEDGRAKLRALFETLDKNADGKVSKKEWSSGVAANAELLAQYFGGSNVGQVGRAFSRIDANNDNSLSWDEFVNASALMSPPS